MIPEVSVAPGAWALGSQEAAVRGSIDPLALPPGLVALETLDKGAAQAGTSPASELELSAVCPAVWSQSWTAPSRCDPGSREAPR